MNLAVQFERALAVKRDVLLRVRGRRARRAARMSSPSDKGGGGLLVYPCDPWSLTGSLGDEAMLEAIGQQQAPGTNVTVLVSSAEAEAAAHRLGFLTARIPETRNFPAAIAAILRAGRYDSVIALGADVMDGHYGVDIVRRMLIAVDLAARAGLVATVLGFSFNTRAPPTLRPYFAGLDPRVVVNVRDPVSHDRLSAFARVKSRLVADSAFTLLPGTADRRALDWIADRRRAGRIVLGFNLHPMLVDGADEESRLAASASSALQSVTRTEPVSWLLIPHDCRGPGIGDVEMLGGIAANIGTTLADDHHMLAGAQRARDIKALAAQLDGVVTGRMHLAIAALGAGVPVLGLAYQDKFQGLFRHFLLDESQLLDRRAALDPARLAAALNRFNAGREESRAKVALRRAHVLSLARRNFAGAV
jgi:polysaccharide pyruvyl transferase WcaK-like protein